MAKKRKNTMQYIAQQRAHQRNVAKKQSKMRKQGIPVKKKRQWTKMAGLMKYNVRNSNETNWKYQKKTHNMRTSICDQSFLRDKTLHGIIPYNDRTYRDFSGITPMYIYTKHASKRIKQRGTRGKHVTVPAPGNRKRVITVLPVRSNRTRRRKKHSPKKRT